MEVILVIVFLLLSCVEFIYLFLFNTVCNYLRFEGYLSRFEVNLKKLNACI
jgi:hypothetical protein